MWLVLTLIICLIVSKLVDKFLNKNIYDVSFLVAVILGTFAEIVMK